MKGVEDIEASLLIEAIKMRYGYDFRNYQFTSIRRRFEHFKMEQKLDSIADIIPRILHDRQYFLQLLADMSVTVTEMFRDPEMNQAIAQKVIPKLQTYPYLNIWNAGCATGEEAYSIAILLEEQNLLKRSQIYATDINPRSIQQAKRGIFPMKEMKKYSQNYWASGGKKSLSQYSHGRYNGVKINDFLMDKITFSIHNLAMDGVFAEMHMIICKNVMIYFNKELQNKVLKLLSESLCFNGFLCLGDKESLEYTDVQDQFETVDAKARIYQKRYPYIN